MNHNFSSSGSEGFTRAAEQECTSRCGHGRLKSVEYSLPDSHSGETITTLEALVETVEADAKLAELCQTIARSQEISEQTLANLQECNRLIELPIPYEGGDLR